MKLMMVGPDSVGKCEKKPSAGLIFIRPDSYRDCFLFLKKGREV
jgi:hypothetical protein